MLRYMFASYKAIKKNFGYPLSTILTFTALLFLRILTTLSIPLDYIFFPKLRKKKIENPIVIVGNPRSGTTFLHRFMVDNRLGAGMRLWKMLFPSLVVQKILSPFLKIVEKINPAKYHTNAAHKTGITSVETDDPSLLFRFFDGFFVYGFFLTWSDTAYIDEFEPANRDTSERDFRWFEKMWVRNTISEKNDRIIAKLFSLGMRLPKFFEYFPDAKILYTIRDPLETVPSGLSLVTGVLDNRYGFWKLPEERRAFFIERLYHAFLELSLKFYEDYVNCFIPKNKIKIIRYDRLMSDFDNVMFEIAKFTDIELTDDLITEIRKISEKQKVFKSEHKYNLGKFGLTKERILKDYEKIYNQFLN
jgi:omega-hydroxy-beta-dihydromenaquinone-9 sulfotransferase